MSGEIIFHLLGGGFGESIVITLPNGKTGVIDCYTPTLKGSSPNDYRKSNPTLRFLRQHLKASRLAFLALTHPHEDHGRGLSELLEDYRDSIDEIWIFDAFQDIGLERYFSAIISSGRRLPIEQLLDEPPGTFSVELMRIRELVVKQIDLDNPHRAVPRIFCGCHSHSIEDATFHFLGPSVALAQSYKANIIDNLRGVVDEDGESVDENWQHDGVNHNSASPSIICEYGSTRVLLGGDMEQVGWDEAINDQLGSQLVSPCHFLKISHHGSSTGYTLELLARIATVPIPVAALTPFNRHAKPLPRADAVSHLSDSLQQIWTTSFDDANRSMGIIDALTHDELVVVSPILERWKRSIEALPSLRGALDGDYLQVTDGNTTATPVTSIPLDWVSDLKNYPRLAALLRPDLRVSYIAKPIRGNSVEHDHRLSFHFDNSGNEYIDRRYVGARCGRLA